MQDQSARSSVVAAIAKGAGVAESLIDVTFTIIDRRLGTLALVDHDEVSIPVRTTYLTDIIDLDGSPNGRRVSEQNAGTVQVDYKVVFENVDENDVDKSLQALTEITSWEETLGQEVLDEYSIQVVSATVPTATTNTSQVSRTSTTVTVSNEVDGPNNNQNENEETDNVSCPCPGNNTAEESAGCPCNNSTGATLRAAAIEQKVYEVTCEDQSGVMTCYASEHPRAIEASTILFIFVVAILDLLLPN